MILPLLDYHFHFAIYRFLSESYASYTSVEALMRANLRIIRVVSSLEALRRGEDVFEGRPDSLPAFVQANIEA